MCFVLRKRRKKIVAETINLSTSIVLLISKPKKSKICLFEKNMILMVDIIYETERIRKIYLSFLVINFNKLKKIENCINNETIIPNKNHY